MKSFYWGCNRFFGFIGDGVVVFLFCWKLCLVFLNGWECYVNLIWLRFGVVCRCIVDFVYMNIGLFFKFWIRDVSVMSIIFNLGFLIEVVGMEFYFWWVDCIVYLCDLNIKKVDLGDWVLLM